MYSQKHSIPGQTLIQILNGLSLVYKTASYIGLSLKSLRKTHFPDAFIISVDNLSFGGTGKTSLVMALANYFLKQGEKFAIVSRGYRSRLEKKGIKVHSNHSCHEIGDEAKMYINRFPGQDIYIGRDRIQSIRQAIGDQNKIIILDDGFQSTHIQKNLSLMLINPYHPYYYLRHFIFMKKSEDLILYYSKPGEKSSLTYQTYHFEFNHFYDIHNKPFSVQNKSLLGFSALGDNPRFKGDLEKFNLVQFINFSDHHFYSLDDIQSLNKRRMDDNIDYLACTEKDFVKLLELDIKDIPLIYARNIIKFDFSLISDLLPNAEKTEKNQAHP